VRRPARDFRRENAASRAELDHAVVPADAGLLDELRSESSATEKVLGDASPTAATGL
jgi:hypothetical protein